MKKVTLEWDTREEDGDYGKVSIETDCTATHITHYAQLLRSLLAAAGFAHGSIIEYMGEEW